MDGMKFVLFVLIAWQAVVNGTQIVSVHGPGWYFTEFNWAQGPDFYQAVNPGAYFKIGFTGTSVGIQFDFTGASTTTYATIKYVIDGKPQQNFQLPLAGNANITTLATGLTNTNHTLAVYVQNSLQEVDRWITPQCVTRVVGLLVDDGASTFSVPLRPKRMIVYWDSIGEGVEVLDTPGTDLTHNEATQTWAYVLAAALQAEVSMVAFGRLGWTVYGNGNVPPVFTPGNDTLSSWNKIDSNHARNFKQQLDYIIIGHGTNDGGSQDSAVEASAYGWLVAQRAAVTNATSIFVCIPFGGFKESALTTVFTNYQEKYTDEQTYLINLGAQGAEGLSAFMPGGTWQSEDGIHPNVWRDGQLGAMLSLAVGSALKYKL